MKINTAPSFPALQQELEKDIISFVKSSPLSQALVITASNAQMRHVQKRLLGLRPNGLAGLHFHHFFSLAQEINSWRGHKPWKPAHKTVLERLIDKILRDKFKNSRFFSTGPEFKGFTTALLSVLNDLTDANVPADFLDEALRSGQFTGDDVTKIKELFTLYEHYTRERSWRDLHVSADIMNLAIRGVQEDDFLDEFKHCFLFGFYDLTGVNLDFLEALLEKTSATMYFPYEKKNDAFVFSELLINHFSITRFNPVTFELPHEGGLSALGDNATAIFGGRMRPKKLRKGNSFTIYSTSGMRDEAWIAAKEILRLKKLGVDYSDIAVSARDLTDLMPHLTEIFDENEIPYHTEESLAAMTHPFIKTALLFLNLRTNDYSRNDVVEILKSPFLALNKVGSGKPINHWIADQLTRELGITSGLADWTGRLGSLISGKNDIFDKNDDKDYINECIDTARKIRDFLVALDKDFIQCESSLPAGSACDRISKHIADHLDLELGGVQCTNAIDSSLRLMANHGDLFSFEDYASLVAMLQELIAAEGFPISGPVNRGVAIADIMTVRGVSPVALILLGMNDKRFPRVVRQEPFLNDSIRVKFRDNVRRNINRLGVKIDEKSKGHDEEKLLFSLACSSAVNHLILTSQRSDEAGKLCIESSFLRDIRLAILGASAKEASSVSVPRRAKEKLAWLTKRFGPDSLTPKEKTVLLEFSSNDASGLFRAVHGTSKVYESSVDCLRITDSIREKALSKYDCLMTDMSGWMKGKFNYGISPTFLEAFGKCPYNFYCSKILKLSHSTDPEETYEVGKRELGSVVHDILSRAYADRTIPSDQVVDKVFDEFEVGNTVGFELYWEKQRAKVKDMIGKFLAHDEERLRNTGFKPAYFEEEDSFLLSIPPYKLHVRGKIDRVDLKQDGGKLLFYVIDYKTGKLPSIGETMSFTALQLYFYLLIGQALVSNRQKKWPDGAVLEVVPYMASYCGLSTDADSRYIPAKGTASVQGDFWETRRSEFAELLDIFTDCSRKGLYFINPLDTSFCDNNCEFRRVCRKENFPSRLKALSDDESKAYFNKTTGK